MQKAAFFFTTLLIAAICSPFFCGAMLLSLQFPPDTQNDRYLQGTFGVIVAVSSAFIYMYTIGLTALRASMMGHTNEAATRAMLVMAAKLLLVPAGAFVVGLVSNSFAFWFIGAFISYVVLWNFTSFQGPSIKPTFEVERGAQLISFEDATRRCSELTADQEPEAFWGGLNLPPKIAETHFCVVGRSGSGKTLSIRLLMQSVFRNRNSTPRAIIYDAKRDILPLLAGMGLKKEPIVFNPLDARSAPWDIANDVTSPTVAQQIAGILIPKEEGPNRYFTDSARALVRGVMMAFIRRAPGKWTLRDVILATKTRARLNMVLASTPDTEDFIEQYLSADERTVSSVTSTIASNLDAFEPIAALWATAKAPPVSLADWSRSNDILVLGITEELRATLDTINRFLFQRASELLLSQEEKREASTWIFLDEAKEAGRFQNLPRLLTNGRSYGIRVVIGFQDIAGFTGTYGEHAANEILAMCGNTTILRVDLGQTAGWAAAQIGLAEVRQRQVNISFPQDNISVTEQITMRAPILAEEIRQIELPTNGKLSGIHITSEIGCYRASFRFQELLIKPQDDVRAFVPRSKEDEYIKPWTPDDLSRLGLDDELPPERDEARLPFPPDTPPPDTLMPRLTRDSF